MKRVISVILSIVVLASVFSVAFADSGITPYASQVIDETTAAIRFSGGKVYGGGQIKSVATADKLGISSIALYEKNGTSWTKLTSASSKYGYNTSNYSYTISAPAPSPKPKGEKTLPVLDYLRISQYYPPGTTVEYMNDDICHHLEVVKRNRLYGY